MRPRGASTRNKGRLDKTNLTPTIEAARLTRQSGMNAVIDEKQRKRRKGPEAPNTRTQRDRAIHGPRAV